MEEINQDDIKVLIEYFSRNMYRAKYSDAMCSDVMQRCLDLATLDYSYVVVPNTNGELSAHYPSQLIIFEAEQPSGGIMANGTAGENSYTHRSTSTIYENVHDGLKLKELFGKARSARCRARFPIPVILFRGKNICRSSTLSGGPEIYGRSGLDFFFSNDEPDSDVGETVDTTKCHNWMLFDQVRHQDIKLLKVLGVGTIVDFMVEKKKVKFGMNVTSSEKVDKENRYNDFKILSLPYPGCEFFKKFRDNNYSAKNLVFNWDQSHVDADIIIPEDNITLQLKVDWKDYKHWDLVTLTENYLLLLLHYLTEGSSGLLVHCISGWDRTPLFISLLRICLWADGAIHQSLSPIQLLYFTIAYDWMLFGHNLEDRKTKGEDIFYFCFYILKHLTRDEFSINRCKGKLTTSAPNVTQTPIDAVLESADYEGGEMLINSQGSNISLHSSWSSISSKSQETPPVFVHTEDPSLGNSGSLWYLPISTQEPVSQVSSGIIGMTNNTTASNVSYVPVTSANSSLSSTHSIPHLGSKSDGNSRSLWYLPNPTQEPISQASSIITDFTNNTTASNVSYAPVTSANSSLASRHSTSPHLASKSDSVINNEGTHSTHDISLCNGCSGGKSNNTITPSSQTAAGIRISHLSRTSPVAVPSRTTAFRQRNESSGSLSVGSWQFITGTGSLRGSGSNSTCSSNLHSNSSNISLCEGQVSAESTNTLTGDEEGFTRSYTPDHSSCNSMCSMRRERLTQLRELFCGCYCRSIGHNLKDGSEGSSGLGYVFGNMFSSNQRTTV